VALPDVYHCHACATIAYQVDEGCCAPTICADGQAACSACACCCSCVRPRVRLAPASAWAVWPQSLPPVFAVCTNTTNVWSGENQSTKRERE
jgi:hypothetical protein